MKELNKTNHSNLFYEKCSQNSPNKQKKGFESMEGGIKKMENNKTMKILLILFILFDIGLIFSGVFLVKNLKAIQDPIETEIDNSELVYCLCEDIIGERYIFGDFSPELYLQELNSNTIDKGG